jgi:hypothetical protein
LPLVALSMAGERLLRILAQLSSGGDAVPGTARVCEVCVDVTDMSGAGIMLMAGGAPGGSVCTTNEVSAVIEELQYTLGEGPCVDAYHLERPVLEPDLADPDAARWLAFAPPAVEAGVRAIFGFPLQVGAVRLGALNLYRDRPGPLTDDQYADALVMAGVAAQAVLAMQAQAPPGMLAAELDEGANFRFVVHQAAGMMSVQLGVGIVEALARLRAYAFADDRLITEVAEAVVGRRLRFDDTGPVESLGGEGTSTGWVSPSPEGE